MSDREEQDLSPSDPAKFDELYERWSEPVFRYLLRLVRDQAQAEDLFQDTWMKVIDRRDQLRDANRFGPWVLRIARNTAFNQMRTKQRKLQVWAVGDVADLISNQRRAGSERSDGDGANPRRSAITAEQREIISHLLAGLAPDNQEILHLRYFEQLTLAEVAQVMEIPLGTVCTKVHRSLKTVRKMMEEQGLTHLGMI